MLFLLEICHQNHSFFHKKKVDFFDVLTLPFSMDPKNCAKLLKETPMYDFESLSIIKGGFENNKSTKVYTDISWGLKRIIIGNLKSTDRKKLFFCMKNT